VRNFLTSSGPFKLLKKDSLDGVIGLVKCGGGILDRYGPNRNATDRFNVVRMLDFTNIREMFWCVLFTLFGKILFYKSEPYKNFSCSMQYNMPCKHTFCLQCINARSN